MGGVISILFLSFESKFSAHEFSEKFQWIFWLLSWYDQCSTKFLFMKVVFQKKIVVERPLTIGRGSGSSNMFPATFSGHLFTIYKLFAAVITEIMYESEIMYSDIHHLFQFRLKSFQCFFIFFQRPFTTFSQDIIMKLENWKNYLVSIIHKFFRELICHFLLFVQ